MANSHLCRSSALFTLGAKQGPKRQEIFFRELANELLPYLKRLQWQSDNGNRERAIARKRNLNAPTLNDSGASSSMSMGGLEIIFTIEESTHRQVEDTVSDLELVRRPYRSLKQSKSVDLHCHI